MSQFQIDWLFSFKLSFSDLWGTMFLMEKTQFEAFLESEISSHDLKVRDYIEDSNVLMVIFLRHFGCTYCRKTLATYKEFSEAYKDKMFSPLFIHMSSTNEGTKMLENYGLGGVAHISDPNQELYKLFSLDRGSLLQHFGPTVLKKGLKDLFVHGVGGIKGDGFQMPGVFMINKNGVISSYRHSTVADDVNFEKLAQGAF
jgi:thiol-disulfide isomerase/thioredoxin